MHWQHKAKIMKLCAHLPRGDMLYRLIQKRFGRMKVDPMARISAQVEMARWILEMGGKIEGKTFFEVGTGHCPIIPIGFFLCRANKVMTVDLHRRLDLGILGKSLMWIVENKDEIYRYYDAVAEKGIFDEKMNLLEKLRHRPKKLLSKANIVYLAPYDASNTDLPDNSVDYHISNAVLEHIPRCDIENILIETKRILKNNGAALHFIDLSDHFQHQDLSITKINFLRYSDKEWDRIAGNEFAYTNRLRASDFMKFFSDLLFKTLKSELNIDQESLSVLKNGFSTQILGFIDKKFSDYTPEDLSATELRVMLCCD